MRSNQSSVLSQKALVTTGTPTPIMNTPPVAHRVPLWTWIVGAAVLIPSILGFANKFLDLMIVASGDEEGAFALTPIMNYLFATAGFFCMLMWAVTQGAFHDLNQPSHAMFENELELDRKTAEGRGRLKTED